MVGNYAGISRQTVGNYAGINPEIPPLSQKVPCVFVLLLRVGMGADMTSQSAQEYLEHAQRAERAAEKAVSELAKKTWLAIAREYRELAAEKLKLMQDKKP